MTRAYKGGLTGVLIMIPVLLGVNAMLRNEFSNEYGFVVVVFTFLAVNLLLAYLFAEERTASGIAMLFLAYALVTLASTVLLGMLLLFIALGMGIVPFRKIGG